MSSARLPHAAWSEQRTVFAVFAAVAVLGAAISWLPLAADYARFLMQVPPPLAALVAGVLGLASVAALERLGWWPHPIRRPSAWLAPAAGLAVPFAAFVVVFDLLAPFPPDLNVGLPWALLFYPVTGSTAQSLLHLVPLVLAFWALRRWGRAGVWAAILLAALPEAVFQAAVGGFGLRGAFVGAHVLAFGVVELWMLRRGGVAAMIAFRLTYYLLWHVIWGAVRLGSGAA